MDSQNFSTTHSTTSAPSPVPNEHIMNSLSSTGAPISGNEALIGHDSRGAQSQSRFQHTSIPSASHGLRVQTSPNGGQLSPLPYRGPYIETRWRSPHHNNTMNQWPHHLLTISPPTQTMLPEYTQPVGQQELPSIQNNFYSPSPTTVPIFHPPAGSLLLYNQGVWEDCRGNDPSYYETVYNAILVLQNQYHELVVPVHGTGNELKYKCGICNQMPNPPRDINYSQRRWDLSPHILSHARPSIKPWFSSCGKSYGRGHDQRRHSESCNECRQSLQSPDVTQAQVPEPPGFSLYPTPASRDNLLFPTPSMNHSHSAQGTNHMVTQLSGVPSVVTRLPFNANVMMFPETVRRVDGGHMTHGDQRDNAEPLAFSLQYSDRVGPPGFGETDNLLQLPTRSQFSSGQGLPRESICQSMPQERESTLEHLRERLALRRLGDRLEIIINDIKPNITNNRDETVQRWQKELDEIFEELRAGREGALQTQASPGVIGGSQVF